MKTPRFEELARRWKGKAEVYIVYSKEAHPRAKSSAQLNAFADQLQALDADRDTTVTLAEYGATAPRFMFDAFDLDHDGVVRSHELLASRRIDQFSDVEAPATMAERIALARRFRAEVPGDIPVLVDSMDGATATAYGGLPNSAYVIASDGRVAAKLAWAAVGDVERELARLTGAEPPPAPAPPDLSSIAASLDAARKAGRPLLLQFTSPGCPACRDMEATTLADAAVTQALGKYEIVRLGVERDDAWRLFEALDLSATPAFVKLGADGAPGDRRQGSQDRDAFLAFLGASGP
jgi:thiol-disulfide isomerase/thioredoxin